MQEIMESGREVGMEKEGTSDCAADKWLRGFGTARHFNFIFLKI